VIEVMNKKTSEVIRQETDTKAKMLYDFIAKHDDFEFAVKSPKHRSQTVIVAEAKKSAAELNEILAPHNLVIGSGYGEFKASQIRIANFPAHSIEDIQRLIDVLSKS
jgi:phosphoserine aminotransferase